MTTQKKVSIVEVGPRDGFQPIGPIIATADKINFITRLHAAGVRRVEATAFVSDTAVPQLADAAEVMTAAQSLDGMDVQVLVPNLRHAERALQAGAKHLAFVLSVSDKHNQNNVRRTPMESVGEYARIVDILPDNVKIRLNIATAYDCPFDGFIRPEDTLDILKPLVEIKPGAEICPCDTTGRVTPDRVTNLLQAAQTSFPEVTAWAYHGHDTYGLGLANVMAAWQAGIKVIDASFAGLGGCPFAPGATGNVATEDVAWMFNTMGIETGIDIDGLVKIAKEAAKLPGALSGGRVRDALHAVCERSA